MEQAQPLNAKAKIVEITFDEFKLIELSKEFKERFDKDKIAFEFNVAVNVNPTLKQIKINDLTRIFLDESKRYYLGEIKGTGIFEVENYSEIVSENNAVPPALVALFVGILIGGVRGMYIIKSQNTFMERIVMPLIDLSSLFLPK